MKRKLSIKSWFKNDMYITYGYFLAFLIVVNFAFALFGLCFLPKSYTIYHIVIIMLIAAQPILGCIFKSTQSEDSLAVGTASIATLILYLLSVFFVTESGSMYSYNWLFMFGLTFCIMIASWTATFDICVKSKSTRAAVTMITFLIIAFMTPLLFVIYLFGDIGSANTSGEYIYSHDNRYCAWVEVYDDGALGGSEVVYARKCSRDIALPFGTIKARDMRLESYMHYDPEYYTISWQDNETLLINGKAYNIKKR